LNAGTKRTTIFQGANLFRDVNHVPTIADSKTQALIDHDYTREQDRGGLLSPDW
jgi:hypothetical protein